MIEIYGKNNCGFCTQAISLLENKGIEFKKYIIEEDLTVEEFKEKFPDVRQVPLIYVDGDRLGGYRDLKAYLGEGN